MGFALLIAAVLALAGCGGDDPGGSAGPSPEDELVVSEDRESTRQADPVPQSAATERGSEGTVITLGESEFGSMLYGSDGQVIYIFENDPAGETVCYDECAEAWPPVLTDADPKAGPGIEQGLLGTVKRDDGELQVSYAAQPLYFYAHESPGEVRCHNVDLNGGFWWVVGPDGERRP